MLLAVVAFARLCLGASTCPLYESAGQPGVEEEVCAGGSQGCGGSVVSEGKGRPGGHDGGRAGDGDGDEEGSTGKTS